MTPSPPAIPRCAECIKRGRECDSMFPDCEYYRRAIPSQKGGVRQARMQQEQKYLIEYAAGLERKLAQLKASRRLFEPATRTRPSTPSGSRRSLPNPAVESESQWWLQTPLPNSIHTYLLRIFNSVTERYHLHFCEAIVNDILLADPDASRQAHPALLNSVYLLAISSGVQLPGFTASSATQAEAHFLAESRKGMTESVALADRLVDYLKACSIVSIYLTTKNRHLEGYHHHCSAARLAVACGMHLNPFATNDPAPGVPNPILSPTSDPLEAIDRIYTFWTLYYHDKIYSIVFGFAPALEESVDASVENLRSLVDTLAGYLPAATLGHLVAHPETTSKVAFSYTTLTTQLKSMAVLHQVRRMCGAKRFGELTNLRVHGESIMNGLPSSACQENGRPFCTRAILQVTQIEIARGSATPDWGAETRPAIALAENVGLFGEEERRVSSIMAQYCCKFAATILEEHRQNLQLLQAPEAEVQKLTRSIDRLESAVTWAGPAIGTLPISRYTYLPRTSVLFGNHPSARRSPPIDPKSST